MLWLLFLFITAYQGSFYWFLKNPESSIGYLVNESLKPKTNSRTKTKTKTKEKIIKERPSKSIPSNEKNVYENYNDFNLLL